ncbi:AsmA family protein [Rhizobiales bacterium GAS191]|nr:AsmA family protein [Rhizobiales bacterium GAS191]
MRDLFVIVGSLLIAVLLAAFAVPRLIDWTPYKARIEAEIAERTGLKLTLAGPMRLEFLPRLALNAQDVIIDSDSATVSAARLRAEVSMASLMGGVPHIVSAELDGGVVKLSLATDGDPAGALIVLLAPGGRELQIDTISLNTVAVTRAENDTPIAMIERGDATLAAREGPLRLTAEGMFGEVRGRGRLAIGSPEADQHRRISLAFDASGGDVGRWRLTFEGQSTATGAAPAALDGAVVLAQVLAQAKPGTARLATSENSESALWRVQAKAHGELRHLRFEEIEISRERAAALRLNGRGALDLGTPDLGDKPRLSLDLSARRLTLDPLLDVSVATPAAGSLGIGPSLTELARLAQASLPRFLVVDFDIGSETVELADERFESVRLKGAASADNLAISSLAVKWPGRGELSFTGGSAAGGHVEVKAADAAALLQGLGLAGDAAAGPVPLIMSGDLSRHDAATRLERLDLSLAGSKITGGLTVFDRQEDRKLRVDADLSSRDLDLDSWPLGAVTSIVPASVEGRLRIHVARLKAGRGAGEVGQLDMSLSRDQGRTLIDTLRLQGFDGLTLEGSGAIGGAGSSFEARIGAPKAAPLAGLARLILPPVAVEALAARRAFIEPLALTLSARREGTSPSIEVTLSGTAATTHIEAKASLDTTSPDLALSPAAGEATLSAPDASTLFNQIGLAAPSGEALGRGELKVTAKPGASGGLAVTANLVAGQTSLSGDGTLLFGAAPEGHGALKGLGGFTAATPSTAAAARLLGLGLRLEGDQRFDIAGGWTLTSESLSLERLNAHLLGIALSGELNLSLAGQRHLDGAIRAPNLSIPALVALALGPTRVNQGYWAASRFPSYTPPPFPVALTITAGLADLGGGLQARDAKLTLALAERSLSLTQASASIAGGTIGGGWRIERDGGLARSTLLLSAEGIELKGLMPGANLAGRISGRLELSGAGETLSQIVASLGGGGSLRIADGRLEQADIAGLQRSFAKAVTDETLMDKTRLGALVAAETARAPLTGVSFEAALVATNGIVRTTVARQDLPSGNSTDGAATLDLKTLTLDTRLGLATLSPGRPDNRVPLAAAITWKGPLFAPKREADAAALLQAVSVERLRIELERIELLEFDQREQATFNRRLKAGRQKALPLPPPPEIQIAPTPPIAPAAPAGRAEPVGKEVPAPPLSPEAPPAKDAASPQLPVVKAPQAPPQPPELPSARPEAPSAKANPTKPEPESAPARPASAPPQAVPAQAPPPPAQAAVSQPAPPQSAPPLPPPIEVPAAPAIAGTPAARREPAAAGRPIILHPPD